MKKVIFTLASFIAVSAVVSSCKKGENDPGFTLLSRKARVANEWKVTSYEETSTTTSNSYNNNVTGTPTANPAVTTSSSTKHEGTKIDISYTQPAFLGSGSTVTVTGTGDVLEHTYTFEKDGTWSSVYTYSTTVINYLTSSGTTYATQTTNTTKSVVNSGVWNFLGGIGKETKNKESMAVSITKSDATSTTITTVVPISPGSVTTTQTVVDNDHNTYAVNENLSIWNITQLKNKELIAETAFDNTYSGDNTTTTANFTDLDYNTTYAVSGKTLITLSKK